MHAYTHTHANLEVPPIIMRHIVDRLRKADYEHAFTIVQGEVVLVDMNGLALICEPKSTSERRVVDFLLEMCKGDQDKVALRMTNDQLWEELCTITSKKGETKMDEAIVCEVLDRCRWHPWTWRIRRFWKKLRGKL